MTADEMPRRLKIAYLMEDTDLSGGVRIQLSQSDGLVQRGHDVTIVTKGLPLTWRRSSAEWIHVDDFSQVSGEGFDFVIGTFWTTVEPAFRMGGPRALHLSQGYEGSFSFYEDQWSRIDEAYSLPVPKLVVSRHLESICSRFGSEVAFVGQIVDDEFFRSSRPAGQTPPRVLLCGASQVGLKGIADGYGAAVHARWSGARFDLIRVSPWVPSKEEPLDEVAEFHTALGTAEMTRLMHSCDVLLAPNHSEEGFGLPAAEALASCIPTVLTRIPSYLSFDTSQDFALFAEEKNPEELGERLVELLSDSRLRMNLGQRGRAVAEQFRSAATIDRLESYLLARDQKLRPGQVQGTEPASETQS